LITKVPPEVKDLEKTLTSLIPLKSHKESLRSVILNDKLEKDSKERPTIFSIEKPAVMSDKRN
jgi:hypothetical protein